ncbi:MAG: hypothetical protein LBU22_13350, partial [Dysgonamonadaceae bacterium]|nr:hypothetical protein [Dysgonamonadaceae bacterium]
MNKTIKDLLKSDKYNNFVVGEDNSIFPLQKKNGAEEVEKTPNSYYENEKKQLTHLNLSGNKIHSLHFLIDAENKDLFADLEYLNLSNNLIRNLCWYPNLEKDGGETSFFTDLPKLKTLDLSRNDIRQGYDCLNNLKECKCTLSEDLSNKHIKNIEFVARATNRGKIALEKNLFLQEMPYFREQKDKNEPLKERLAKYFEDFKKVDTKDFPVKIMFLGNHAAGKSTYRANVLKVGEVDGSTHILNVSEYKYETDTENNDYENIKAFIYDFGGQDYYHGIYRAFFTNDALNLLFWCKKTNENKEDFDSNDQDKPEAERKKIRNYNLENWLTQLKYSYSKDRENWNDKNPILIFQTHADEVEYKKTVQFLNPNFKLDEYQVVNDFFVSLNQETVEDKLQELAYSKNFLDKIIDEVKAKEDIAAESKIKVLYEAINKFDEKQQKEIPVKKSELKSKVTDENLDDILHRGKNRGLILHYPNHPTIQDKIWLKPENLVKYIHGHICTKCLINNGIFKYAAIKTDACNKTTEERNKISCDKNCKLHFDSTILELLEAEKVIFKNKGENGVEYIIPSYLPLAKKDKNFELQKFGFANPNFTLKFLYFIPFGLINQLICYFGNLPDIKRYWRDNVIFTFLGRFKVWIELNFEELTISA